MGTGWIKSLQCKSRALDDVAHVNTHTLFSSSTCIKDAAVLAPKPKPKPKPKQITTSPREAVSYRRSVSDQALTSLTELPAGHPSRNVVEIIFLSSWESSHDPKPFSGRIEVIFKVNNAQRTVSRFEEYRLKVISRAAGDTRCAADGNEMMRFHCLGPTADYGAWGFPKGAGICTFSGSGRAHESASGGGGRRAMLVCRVIAGRVSNRVGSEGVSGFHSASGDSGELVVCDPRAVLPCFLVIYKL